MSTAPMPNRSLGAKLLIVCALAILMSLPAFAVFGLIYDRTNRAQAVVQEVGERFGGEQGFLGPILVAPYTVTRTAPSREGGPDVRSTETGWYMVFAETGEAQATADTDVRSRGDLFKVRTYSADIRFRAAFDLTGQPSAAPDGAVINWARAAILIGIADPRGIQGRADIEVSGRGAIPLAPGSAYADVLPQAGMGAYAPVGAQNGVVRPLQWLVAEIGQTARPGAQFEVTTALRSTGVESLGLAAFAMNTDIRMRGDWDNIGYFGAFPRIEERGDAAGAAETDGFDARWSIPFVARGVAAAGPSNTLGALLSADVRIRFIDPSNPYQSVTRSLKYALLFVGVVFLAFFLFEATGDRRVHPAQYVLVGLAQIIFYLLLLAIAERTGFDVAFLIAAGATVALVAFYLGAIFKNRARGAAAFVGFGVLYGLIYLLMRIEDYALLAGSIAAFLVIAAVMWFTRNLDWYGFTNDLREARAARTEPRDTPAP